MSHRNLGHPKNFEYKEWAGWVVAVVILVGAALMLIGGLS
jgi:hypothetical protein